MVGALSEDCHPLRAHMTQYPGSKPWHPMSWLAFPYSVARAAEYNALVADSPPTRRAPCWPGSACALLAVTLSDEARSVTGRGNMVRDSKTRVYVVPCTSGRFSVECKDIDCCLPRSENGIITDVFAYYSVTGVVAGGSLSASDVMRGVYGGAMEVERLTVNNAGSVLRCQRGRGSARLVIAFDSASHITALLVAAAVGRRSALLVSATPREALACGSECDTADMFLIVASPARLRPLCQRAMLNRSGNAASVLMRPIIWLPSESATNDAAALATALSPCASALWAHEPVLSPAPCHARLFENAGACAESTLPVHIVARAASVALVARIRDGEHTTGITLLMENAISGAACEVLAAQAGGDSVACWDVGDVMSGRTPTAAELRALAKRGRAVVVSYDAVTCAGGGGVLGSRLVAVPPSIVALSVAGVRVIAWCISTLFRRGADVCCGMAVPASVTIVESADGARVAAAETIARSAGSDRASDGGVDAVANAALRFWHARP